MQIRRKLIFVVAAPVVVQVALGCVIASALNRFETLLTEDIVNKRLTAVFDKLHNEHSNCMASALFYGVGRSPDMLKIYRTNAVKRDQTLQMIHRNYSDTPANRASTNSIVFRISKSKMWEDGMITGKMFFYLQVSQTEEGVMLPQYFERMTNVFSPLRQNLVGDNQFEKALNKSESDFIKLLLVGLMTNLTLIVTLFWFVQQQIAMRIKQVEEYVNDIIERGVLPPPLRGHDEISAVARQIHAGGLRMLSHIKFRSEVFAFVNHDARAPLTAVAGFLSLARAGRFGTIEDDYVHDLKKAELVCLDTALFMQDVLELEKVRQGQSELTIDTYEVSEVLELIEQGIDRQGMILKIVPPQAEINFSCDAYVLARAISSLCNRMSHPHAKQIMVALTLSETESNVSFHIRASDITWRDNALERSDESHNATDYVGHVRWQLAQQLASIQGGHIEETPSDDVIPAFSLVFPRKFEGKKAPPISSAPPAEDLLFRRLDSDAEISSSSRKQPTLNNRASFIPKILLTVLIPVLLSSVSLVGLTLLLTTTQARLGEENRSRQIVHTAQHLRSAFIDMIMLAVLQNTSGRQEPIEMARAANRDVDQSLDELRALLRGGTGSKEKQVLANLEAKARRMKKIQVILSNGKPSDLPVVSEALFADRKSMAWSDFFADSGREIIEKEQAESKAQRLRQNTRRDLYAVLIIGTAVGLLSSVISLSFLYIAFLTRFYQLERDARNLFTNETMGEPVSGNDELSHLDRFIHSCSLMLREKNQERQRVLRYLNEYLRTKLEIIRSLLVRIRDNSQTLSEAGGKRFSDTIAEIIRLEKLLDELVDMDAIEMRSLSVKINPHVSVNKLVETAVAAVRASAEREAIEIVIDKVDLVVKADEERTVRVLINLLSNAIKHSSAGQKVVVKVVKLTHKIRIEVIDQGPGISDELKERLFDRFAGQAESGQSRDSIGLGLYIVRSLMQAQDGEVGVRNMPGEGSAFWITLPW